jgi:hypothetical protein
MVAHVDGNALAGPLSAVLQGDASTTACRCRDCGDTAMIAQANVYRSAIGAVARCRRCDNVLIVVTELADQVQAGFPGIAWLRA